MAKSSPERPAAMRAETSQMASAWAAMKASAVAVVLVAGMAWSAAPAEAQDASLAPHRAAYALTMGTAKTGGVASIDGAMSIDWQETCDGWTMSQRMRFRIFDADGDSIENDISFSSWEARDGTGYRFTMRTLNDDEVIEDLRGRATLVGRDKGGRAVFTSPAEEVIELPPGTLFPTRHTLLLIDQARAGTRGWARPVFDGATVDGAMEVNAVIGPRLEPAAGGGELLSGTSWRVRLAFFPADDQRGSEPEYETEMRLYESGVGSDFVFDYPEFSIKARLERLEPVPRPRC
jgi:hypothetical protein